MRFILFVFIIALLFIQPSYAAKLKSTILAQTENPLEQVGEGTYRKLGFTIYRAKLWAPDGVWKETKPYALQLTYEMSLSKDTLVGTVIDNIREQGNADSATIKRWETQLNETLPAVKSNDELVGLAIPGKDAVLFLNGKEIARISEKALSDAFFSIWLGPGADSELQTALLAGNCASGATVC